MNTNLLEKGLQKLSDTLTLKRTLYRVQINQTFDADGLSQKLTAIFRTCNLSDVSKSVCGIGEKIEQLKSFESIL